MRTYRTQQGDLWDVIAYRMYPDVGREMCMSALIQANEQHRNIAIFPAGIELSVPDIDIPAVSGLPPWKRSQARS
ncbi:MAG: tail protein X [Synergistaceae bacterium]|jgi:phage tail protein X|nr:tail protein X [Synergistaceae bacterium]